MWNRRKKGDAKNSGSSRGMIETGPLPPWGELERAPASRRILSQESDQKGIAA